MNPPPLCKSLYAKRLFPCEVCSYDGAKSDSPNSQMSEIKCFSRMFSNCEIQSWILIHTPEVAFHIYLFTDVWERVIHVLPEMTRQCQQTYEELLENVNITLTDAKETSPRSKDPWAILNGVNTDDTTQGACWGFSIRPKDTPVRGAGDRTTDLPF